MTYRLQEKRFHNKTAAYDFLKFMQKINSQTHPEIFTRSGMWYVEWESKS